MVAPIRVANINVHDADITYIVGNTQMDYWGVLALVDDIMNKTLEYTIPSVKSWIQTYVAKRTGQLQDDLIRTLETSQWLNDQLRLELGTMLQYAKKVNSGSQRLRHNNEWGYAYYYGYSGLILLNDPNAQDKFWGLLKWNQDGFCEKTLRAQDLKYVVRLGLVDNQYNEN